MKILVHVCCAPCFTYPHKRLEEEGHSITGFFYNPNIHPYTEYKARLNALRSYESIKPVDIIYNQEYPLMDFIQGQMKAMSEGKMRCEFCIRTRIDETAKMAKENDFEAFTTTLLESRYQPHEMIKVIGVELEKKYNLIFHYEDFRIGFRESIDLSKEMGLYRQKYCGCIFSEAERYDKKIKKDTSGSKRD